MCGQMFFTISYPIKKIMNSQPKRCFCGMYIIRSIMIHLRNGLILLFRWMKPAIIRHSTVDYVSTMNP